MPAAALERAGVKGRSIPKPDCRRSQILANKKPAVAGLRDLALHFPAAGEPQAREAEAGEDRDCASLSAELTQKGDSRGAVYSGIGLPTPEKSVMITL